jgi:hypothetical protein
MRSKIWHYKFFKRIGLFTGTHDDATSTIGGIAAVPVYYTSAFPATTARWFGASSLNGSALTGDPSDTVSEWTVVIPADMTLTKMYIAGDAAPGEAKTCKVTLYKNGSATTLEATLGADDTDKTATGSIALEAGDLISLKVTKTSGGTTAKLACVLSGTITEAP